MSLVIVHGGGRLRLISLLLKLLEGEHISATEDVLSERVRAFRVAPLQGAPSSIGIDGERPLA